MTIALVAHDSKKELMVQFCTAYRHILAQHHLIATGTTGRLVEENVGLPVQKFLPGGHGGGQQVMARIACEEVDMLLFFRDPIAAKPSANIQVDGQVAVIEGIKELRPAPLRATDLRAGAAMVVAALAANGVSEIDETIHIERGYENIVEKLQLLGADIRRVEIPASSISRAM